MTAAQPPYARRAKERLSAPMQGRAPAFGTLFVHTGHGAWDACRDDTRAAVLLPPGQWPEGFDWSVVKLTAEPFKSVLVLDTGSAVDQLKRLGRCLIQSGAGHVAVLPKGGRAAFFKPSPEMRRGA